MKCVECQKEITKTMECVYKIYVDKPLCKECCENKNCTWSLKKYCKEVTL